MKAFRYVVAGTALAMGLTLAPQAAEAQDTRDWWGWALGELVRSGRSQALPLPRRDDRYPDRYPRTGDRYPDQYPDRYPDDRYERRGKKNGPKFCQSGAGHPVHGRQWCRDKGYDVRRDRRDVYWEDRGWEDIILRAPRRTDRRGGIVDNGGLIDVLGDIVFRRVDGERRRLGGREPLTGRWMSPAGGARVLQIRSGSLPVAELTDLDGDGRIDAALVPRRR